MAKTYTIELPAGEPFRINAVWVNGFVNECKETVSGNRATIVGDDDSEEFDLTKGTRFGTENGDRKPHVDLCNKLGVAVTITLTLSRGKYSNSLFEDATAVSIANTVDVQFPTPQKLKAADGFTDAADVNVGTTASSADQAPPANAIGAVLNLITSGVTHGAVRVGSSANVGASRGIPLPVNGDSLKLPINETLKVYNGHGSSIDFAILWITRS